MKNHLFFCSILLFTLRRTSLLSENNFARFGRNNELVLRLSNMRVISSKKDASSSGSLSMLCPAKGIKQSRRDVDKHFKYSRSSGVLLCFLKNMYIKQILWLCHCRLCTWINKQGVWNKRGDWQNPPKLISKECWIRLGRVVKDGIINKRGTPSIRNLRLSLIW